MSAASFSNYIPVCRPARYPGMEIWHLQVTIWKNRCAHVMSCSYLTSSRSINNVNPKPVDWWQTCCINSTKPDENWTKKCDISIALVTNLKHSTLGAALRKINSTPTRCSRARREVGISPKLWNPWNTSLCKDTPRSGRLFAAHCWDLVLQRRQAKKLRQHGLLCSLSNGSWAISATVTAKLSILISTQRIKTKDYTVKSETIGSNPCCCRGQNSCLLHTLPILLLLWWSCPTTELLGQTVLRSRAVWGVTMPSFDSSQQISLKTQRLSRKPFCPWKNTFLTPATSLQLVLSEHLKLAKLKTV